MAYGYQETPITPLRPTEDSKLSKRERRKAYNVLIVYHEDEVPTSEEIQRTAAAQRAANPCFRFSGLQKVDGSTKQIRHTPAGVLAGIVPRYQSDFKMA